MFDKRSIRNFGIWILVETCKQQNIQTYDKIKDSYLSITYTITHKHSSSPPAIIRHNNTKQMWFFLPWDSHSCDSTYYIQSFNWITWLVRTLFVQIRLHKCYETKLVDKCYISTQAVVYWIARIYCHLNDTVTQ